MKRNIFFPILTLVFLFFLASANPVMTIIDPNGGEELVPGKTTIIKWNYINSSDSDNDIILVLYKNGMKFNTISESTPNTGMFIWEIPSNTPVGNKYRIRIRSRKDLTLNDFSDGDFSIVSK